MANNYLQSVTKHFDQHKLLGEKTFDQLSDEQLFWQFNSESNSVATIVKHLSGNMRSRWTDFLNSDGEKAWRNREDEFEGNFANRAVMLQAWKEGWDCLFAALKSLTEADLERTIYIRNTGQSVMDAINRQLAHYPYHVGQIVYIGKMALDANWKSLSIPRGKSKEFNDEKFAKPKN